MNPERWQRIKEVAFAAMEMEEEQRSQFLDKECGSDSELRRAVEALVDEDQRNGGTIEREIASVAAGVQQRRTADDRDAMLGRTISHYKITDKLDEVLDIGIQTAQGLQAAHEKDIVHRDIKSANLMVTPQGQVKIMDFGLAQLADRSRLTETTTILGTPSYMSPEQAVGDKTDRRTDLWSLGAVLYEMVTGRRSQLRPSLKTGGGSSLNSVPLYLVSLLGFTPLSLKKRTT